MDYTWHMKMSCRKPQLCKIKHERWVKNQKKFVPIGEKEHETFIEHVNNDTHVVTRTEHSKIRDYERVIREDDIADVTNYGWVIERNYWYETQLPRVVIMGYTKKQRPLHLVYEVEGENAWKLITVYTPLNKPYKWKDGYTSKTCFCD